MTSRKGPPDALDAAWTEQERELLNFARQERMPSQIEARLRKAFDQQLGYGPVAGAHEASRHAESATAARPGHTTSQVRRAANQPASTPLPGSGKIKRLFGSKLSLWGVLSLFAIGSVAYFGLRGSAASTGDGPRAVLTPTAAETAHAAAADALEPAVTLPPARQAVQAAPLFPAVGVMPQRIDAAHGGNAASGAEHERVAAAPGGNARAAGSGLQRERAVAAHGGKSSPAAIVDARDTAAHVGDARVALNESRGTALNVDELRLEAELLDGARRALSRGALQEARQQLARYAARFARGSLLPESDVLGIELEMRTGFEHEAQSHATRFLAQYPNHPLRERVRKLVATQTL